MYRKLTSQSVLEYTSLLFKTGLVSKINSWILKLDFLDFMILAFVRQMTFFSFLRMKMVAVHTSA